MPKAITYIDLFSGIGGFREGLSRAGGFVCVGHCEIDKYADQSYRALFDTKGEWFREDVREADPDEMPDFDLLCGGFPCQSFSIAGHRGGFADPRGTLFFEIARLTAAKRPAYLLLENVPGLLNHDGGRTFAAILHTLDGLGYCAAHPDSLLQDNPSADTRYGFRINTGKYSYWMVCSFLSTDCRLWVNAFSFLSLDRYMREARNGIPILDLQGHERFRMPDGGKLKVVSPNGRSSFWTIRCLDTEQAVLFDELRQSSIHAVQELPEWAAKSGLHLLPLDSPMRASHKPHRKGQER